MRPKLFPGTPRRLEDFGRSSGLYSPLRNVMNGLPQDWGVEVSEIERCLLLTKSNFVARPRKLLNVSVKSEPDASPPALDCRTPGTMLG
jgi:hypothetical protein